MGDNEIPNFPPLCVATAPETKCEVLGIPFACVPSVPQDATFENMAYYGHWISATFLIGIALYSYVFQISKGKREAYSMTIQTTLYAVATAFLVLFRFYGGVSNFLIFWAVVYNLFKWSFFDKVSAWVGTKEDSNNTTYKHKNSAIIIAVLLLVLFFVPLTRLQTIAIEQVLLVLSVYARPSVCLSPCVSCCLFIAYRARGLTQAQHMRMEMPADIWDNG